MVRKLSFAVACAIGFLSAGALTLENDAMCILFRDDGGFGVTGIVNKVAGNVVFGKNTGDIDFWKLSFSVPGQFSPMNDTRGGDYVELMLSNRNRARKCRIERVSDLKAVFVWEGMDLVSPTKKSLLEAEAVDVRAMVELLPGIGESRWTIDVNNHSSKYALTTTTYPIIKWLGRPGDCDVLVPRSNLGAGLVHNRGVADPGRRDKNLCGGAYMGYQPMVTAFMQDGAGIYYAAHDPEGRIKTLYIDDNNTPRFNTVVENAGIVGKAAGGPKYPVIIDAFKGDWWWAAKKYRDWAMKQVWTAKGPIIDRSDYPKTMSETPFWINIHGDSSVASNVLAGAKECFPDFATGLHWHRWNKWGHDSHYPEYFPTVPGVKEVLPYLNSLGQQTMIYTNGRLWDGEIPSWEMAMPFATMRPNGERRTERYANKRLQGVMCPYTQFWQDTMCNLASRITGELDAPGMFMDQIGAAGPQLCYDPTHGHPLGGGTYWFDGYRKLLSRAHAITFGNGAFLTTEGTGEPWMDNVDGYLCVTLFRSDDVPWYPAVYSGYTTYFCSPQAAKDSVGSFWALQARQVLWGVAPGWFEPSFVLNRTNPDIAEKRSLIGRLCRLRQRNLDYLAYGELVGDVVPENDVGTIEVVWNGRWQRAAQMQKFSMPAVIGSVWKHARTGRLAKFVVNLSESVKQVVLDGVAYEIEPRGIKVIDGDDPRPWWKRWFGF